MSRFIIASLLFSTFTIHSFGQTATLSGPTSVTPGNTYEYRITWSSPPSSLVTYQWWVSGGTNVSSSISNAYITWNGSGSIVFQYTVSGTTYTLPTYNVSAACGANPAVSFTLSTNTCSPRPLSYTGTPPAGVTWYWQTSATGTSMSNSSNTYNVTATGTYYVRAYQTATSCWGGTASYAVTSITSGPSTPGAPFLVSDAACGSKALSYNNPPAGITYYWQFNDPNGTSTTYTGVMLAFNTGTYYLRARNISTGCWSANASSISVTINNPPADPPAPGTTSNGCGPQTLTRSGSPPPGVTWYWQGTNPNGTDNSSTGSTYSAGSSGTYYIRAGHSNGCWSPGSASVAVSVNPLPSTPSFTATTNLCGPKTLTMASAPGGVTWYWQGTDPNGTSTANSSATYTVTVEGTYYLRARNNTTGCWSSAFGTLIILFNIPATPAVPTVSSNCGSRTLSYTGLPTNGAAWYWQGTNPDGMDATSSAATSATYTVTSSGTYYLRARLLNSNGGCWSSSVSVSVTINNPPATPTTPFIISSDPCGSKALSFNAPPAGVEYYWQDTNPNGTSTSNHGTGLALTTGTYYLRARDMVTGCWSVNSSSIAVTVIEPPPPPTPFIISTEQCGPKTLSRAGTPPGGVTWHWQSVTGGSDFSSAAANGATFTVNNSGTYYLRARNSSGCWGGEASSFVTINHHPEAPPAPVASTNMCYEKTLFKSASEPTGFRWYWQGIDANGTDYTSAVATGAAYSASLHGTSTYYLRTRNTSTGCWSLSATGIQVAVNNPPAPNPNSFEYCEVEPMVLTTTGYANSLNWYFADQLMGYHATPYTPNYLGAGSHTFKVKNIDGSCESTLAADVTVLVRAACDEFLNWVELTDFTLNESGTAVPFAASRSYLDGYGNTMQDQIRSYATNQVLATQTIYDYKGFPALNTLPAPINSSSFVYRHRFVTNSNGQKYSATDFDRPGLVNAPLAVANTGPGSLGWYYSTANTDEPYTPVTTFPYARSWTEEGTDPKNGKAALPGDQYKMGSGHETKYQKEKILVGELDHYYKLRPLFDMTPSRFNPNLLASVSTSSTTDFGLRGTASIASSPGYMVVTASGTTAKSGVWPVGGNITVTPGKVYTFRVKGYVANGSTANVNLWVSNTSGGNIVWAGAALPKGSAKEDWVSSTFTVPSGVTTIRLGVVWPTPVSGQQFYISGVDLRSDQPTASTGYKYITTDADGKKLATFIDLDGTTLASALVTSTTAGTPPTYTYDYWNYTFYNGLGQVVATVAPNGVNTSSNAYPGFTTTYKYNHLGGLVETTSVDEGTTKYIYSFDGKLRFSQNQAQAQASPKKFSYTNYDYLGRLVESGEYTSNGTNPFIFDPLSSAANSVTSIVDKVLPVGKTIDDVTPANYGPLLGVSAKGDTRCKDYMLISYDYPAADLITDTNHPSQNNLTGQISKTENANAKTWYSYDEFGQLDWTKQHINDLDDKTVDYTYDYMGNVTRVAYQTGTTSEAFYHYYVYDNDQQLIKVLTSRSGTANEATDLRANYKYYLHGPLKRIELVNGTQKIQGIDYVYTITGELKSINSGDPASDPGSDQGSGPNASFRKDVFGETLLYHDNDYTGAGGLTPGNVTLNTSTFPNQYGGNLQAMAYNNATELTLYGESNAKHIFGYQYDSRNQLTDAQWGSVAGTAATFGEMHRESITGVDKFDKNGNIQGLLRKGKTGQTREDYAYTYTTGTNRLQQVTTGGTPAMAYTYNALGQMTQKQEGSKTQNVEYTAFGVVSLIKDASNKKVQSYHYDDRGDMLRKIAYNASEAPVHSTWYVRDASGTVLSIYEQDHTAATIQQTELPVYGAGRIGMYKPQGNTYLYEVDDHLGNVRAVIGGTSTDAYATNFETGDTGEFENYGIPYDDTDMNSTAGASSKYSQILIGGYNTKVGLARSLVVSPGDKITFEAFAKYRNLTTTNSGLTGFAGLLTAAFNLTPPVPGDPGIAYNALNAYGTLIEEGYDHSESATAPKAFLNILLFDKSHNFVDATYAQIDVNSVEIADNGIKEPHEHLVADYTVTEPGYAYLFLSNENLYQVDVNFDDVAITHEHAPVVSGADYYPFGLPLESSEITDEPYRYGYQGQFSEKDATTGYNEFAFRQYDARIGRWMDTDPEGQFSSPYVGMGNQPNIGIDPTGGWYWGTAAIGFGVGAAVGYIASDGDWGWTLAAGVAGGLLGGASFTKQPYSIVKSSQVGYHLGPGNVVFSLFDGSPRTIGAARFTLLILHDPWDPKKGSWGWLDGHVFIIDDKGKDHSFRPRGTRNGKSLPSNNLNKNLWHSDGSVGSDPVYVAQTYDAESRRGYSHSELEVRTKLRNLRRLKANIKKASLHPPDYRFIGKRCAGFAMKMMRKSKIVPWYSKFRQFTPRILERFMERRKGVKRLFP